MIVRAAKPDEYAEIGDLVYEAFKHSEIERTIIRVTTEEDPNFRREDLRVTEVDGKIASMMMIIRRPLRIGTSIANGAIVAPVATHPCYQRRGYCSAVMRDAVQYMEAEGFDITILWGIPWLYPHYGYSTAMVKTELVIKPPHEGSEAESQRMFRSFAEDDLEQMTRIYHSNTATRTFAEVRSPKMWEWKPRGSGVRLEVLEDKRGSVIGYRSLGRDWQGRPCVHEVGVLDDQACRTMFDSLLETARRKEVKEFPCVIHTDHPFCRFALQHSGEIRMHSSGGAGMAQVLNLASILTKMSSEFGLRLRHSEFHKWKGTLLISSNQESVCLEIDSGRVSTRTDSLKGTYQLGIPITYLTPLLMGYRSIRELAADSKVKLKGGKQSLRLIEVLFPTGFAFGGFLPLVWE